MSVAIAGTGNDYADYSVLTNRGIVSINDVNIGDYVYEFNTGRKIMVKGLEQSDLAPVYQVIYNDGRSKFFLENQMIYTGKMVCMVDEAAKMKHEEFGSINPKRIEFDQNPVIEGLDPYTMGMLYAFGDFTDTLVNLPISGNQASRLLSEKYTFIDVGEIGHEKCCFRYHDSYKNITWRELLNFGDDVVPAEFLKDIPYAYMYTTVKNRIQFITGIFDFGFDYDTVFRKSVGIIGNDLNRLQEIQRMLWSLGVVSCSDYNRNMSILTGINYMLSIYPTAENNGYPKFFYNVEKINRFLTEDNAIDNAQVQNFEVKPKFFKRIGTRKKWAYNLVLEEPQAIFITKNYLPHVSV